jgi:hypothetical protein
LLENCHLSSFYAMLWCYMDEVTSKYTGKRNVA